MRGNWKAGAIKELSVRIGGPLRLALIGVVALAALSISGCLARSTGPTLPYVMPAQSVPATDPTAIRIASRVEEMEGEIQRLRGHIEQLGATGGNEPVIRNLQDRVAAIERQLGMDPSRNPSGIPQPILPAEPRAQARPRADARPAGHPAPPGPADQTAAPVEIQNDPVGADEGIYRDAYALYKNKSYDQAANLFEDLLKQYPQSQLAADATYWIGEARFGQGRFDEAVLQFDRVIKEFPGSKKELNALLKQGQAFEKMGDPKSAKIIYQQLVSQNPHTAQGRVAAGRLKALPRSEPPMADAKR
jgi:tol-pal system protein YbgF